MDENTTVNTLLKILQEAIRTFEHAGEDVIKELTPEKGDKIFGLFEKYFEEYIAIEDNYASMHIPVGVDKTTFCFWAIRFICKDEESWGKGAIDRWTGDDGHEIILTTLYSMVEELKRMSEDINIVHFTPQDIYVYERDDTRRKRILP